MEVKGRTRSREVERMTFKKGHAVPQAWRDRAREANLGRTNQKGKHNSPATEFKRGHKINLGKHYSKERKDKIRDAQLNQHSSPSTEFKIGHGFSEATLEKMSRIKKLAWQNPEYASARLKQFGVKPNGEEMYLDAILQLHFPHEWKYVGDGKFWIEGKNPDFVNVNGKKILIEYNGYKRTHTVEYDKRKTEHYAKYGWMTINLYPKDLREDVIIQKVRL
jgi:hypothetical protein